MKGKTGKSILTLPAIIVVALVTQIPIIVTLCYSFFQWIVVRPDLPRKFVGFIYYKKLFSSSEFWLIFQNTILLTFFSLAACLALGITFAFLLYRHFPGAGIVRTLLISPFFIMDSVIGVFWRNVMLEPSFGLIHHIHNFLGLQTPALLAQHPLFIISALIIWKWTPFFMLVLMAGLQSIPLEILEAAVVDGTNAWQRIYRIILPMLMKYITISLMLGLIFILKTFGLVFTTTHGGPGFASTNFPYYVYRTTFLGWNIGKGSSIAIILVIISLAIVLVLFKLLRKAITEEDV
ncbi:sugar ABC transporter permease [bacterium]|nr:sugar ABC transporter permease [bacterium]